nr:hypothetical protein BaRGS_011493 [Batillaria attramentaria]
MPSTSAVPTSGYGVDDNSSNNGNTDRNTAIVARTFIAGGDSTTIHRLARPYTIQRVLVGAREHAWISTPTKVRTLSTVEFRKIPDQLIIGAGYKQNSGEFDTRNNNRNREDDDAKVVGIYGLEQSERTTGDEQDVDPLYGPVNQATDREEIVNGRESEGFIGGGRDKQLMQATQEELSAFMEQRNRILGQVLDNAFSSMGIGLYH